MKDFIISWKRTVKKESVCTIKAKTKKEALEKWALGEYFDHEDAELLEIKTSKPKIVEVD